MKKLIILLLATAFLSGCGGGYANVKTDGKVYKSWRKEGVTIEQLQKDYAECDKYKWPAWRGVNKCMREKGYVWE